MRVGVYIDGFNLYYGGRSMFGRGTQGWKWLDLRALSARLASARQDWAGSIIERVVYCTARVDGLSNPSNPLDQDVYLRALTASRSADVIEFGYYVTRVKRGALARSRAGNIEYLDQSGAPLTAGARPIVVGVAQREEKGSDVNVADTFCSTASPESLMPRSSSPTTATSPSLCRRLEPKSQSGSSTRRRTISPAHSGVMPATA